MYHIVEKEIKVLDINKKKLCKKLEKLGARKQFSGKIHDVYYDYPDQRLEQADKRLRLRKKGESTYITMKHKISSTGIRSNHEYETELPDMIEAKTLVDQQGLLPCREKKKKRISYTYKGVIFDIDMYKGLPALLEIEADSEKKIMRWIKKLGLEKKTTATFGSRGLFNYYAQAA